jgi:alpha-ribazole phosphatase/probable phosphoglycerate mutase
MTTAESRLTTVVDLIRHGEPRGGRKYRGQTDDPLSDKGWDQMRAAVADERPWDVIVSSTLSRCLEFARELSARHGLPLETDPRLVEIGMGAWEGRTPAELEADDPHQIVRFRDDPLAHPPPGGEPLAAFAARIAAAWRDVLARHAGRHVLIVGHAGVIRMVVREVLEVPLARVYRVDVPNAGITRVRVERRAGRLLPQLLFHAGRL